MVALTCPTWKLILGVCYLWSHFIEESMNGSIGRAIL